MTLADALPKIRSLPARMNGYGGKMASELGQEMFALVVQYSSGPISSAQLAAEDHPYAKRHGAPMRDPSVINIQTGRFQAGWGLSLRPGANRYDINAHNEVPYADFLKQGTRLMFARPMDLRVLRELPARRIVDTLLTEMWSRL